MSNPFVAEIRIFAGNFAPTGWAQCNGQLMPISQNTALFSLVGTMYGGNGTSNFALPNLQGSTALGLGQGPGLSQRTQGETGGEQTVTLLATEMPAHSHVAQAAASGGQDSPSNNAWGEAKLGKTPLNAYAPSNPPANVTMNTFATSVAGANFPHNNMPPFMGLMFIIALTGVFPSRG